MLNFALFLALRLALPYNKTVDARSDIVELHSGIGIYAIREVQHAVHHRHNGANNPHPDICLVLQPEVEQSEGGAYDLQYERPIHSLEINRNVCQEVDRCLREVECLVVTLTIPHIRIAVAIRLIEGREEVVDSQAKAHLTLGLGLKRIAEVEIRYAVAIERQGLNLVIRKILLSNILRMPQGAKATYMEVGNKRAYDRGRVRDTLFAKIFAIGGAILEFIDIIPNLVLRKRSICRECKPLRNPPPFGMFINYILF